MAMDEEKELGSSSASPLLRDDEAIVEGSATVVADALDPLDRDVEKAEEQAAHGDKVEGSSAHLTFWIATNVLSTVAIVSVNKSIFSDPSFKLCQSLFGAFHFLITYATLFVISRPPFSLFTPVRASIPSILPLSVAMALNILLMNLSLAFSSITFYQIVRILLTPVVALINLCIYGQRIPAPAVLTLIPACVGVGIVSYYDAAVKAAGNEKATSAAGVIFGFTGIVVSSFYTVWIGRYHKILGMNSMQLLYNQVPVAGVMLVWLSPWTDAYPVWAEVPLSRWMMILLSGLCACLVNVSQFFIINSAGAVSGTVVGHMKTCLIVALGWFQSGRTVGDGSIFGIFLAVAGIFSYSYVMYQVKA